MAEDNTIFVFRKDLMAHKVKVTKSSVIESCCLDPGNLH
jgi:hypothetical protein